MKKLWKITLILSIIGIVSLISIFIVNNNIEFSLNGNKDIEIPLEKKYIDEGYKLTLFNKKFNKKVTTNSNINTAVTGTYTINYQFKLLGKKYKLERTIKVIDNKMPEIILNGKDEIILFTGDAYEEEGAIATDNYDKDITDNIIINSNLDTSKPGTYEITYTVTDSSGNQNSVKRMITIKEKEIEKKEAIQNYSGNVDTYNNNDKIANYIKENNYNVSIGYYNLVTGEEYYYRENKIYYGASLIKTLDALYLYDNNMVTEDIEPYINKAISQSDNDAHYYLINYIGKNNLKNYGIALGATNTLSGSDNYGSTTVKDQIIYLKKLYNISNNNNKLKDYFINNYGNYLKFGNLTIMHKYGYWSSYYHDVGIVLDDNPYIIVVLTEHGNNNEKEVIGNISKLIYKYHNNEL